MDILKIKIPLCLKCKNMNTVVRCKAFVNGIPEEILAGKFDHRKKFPGQENDIVFEPIKDKKTSV